MRSSQNVANMRHLWVMAEAVSFAWRADKDGDGSQLLAELERVGATRTTMADGLSGPESGRPL
jgi:hypothetical protein